MKIFASDFDGTLCCSGVISERTTEAIARFRAAGNVFCVVTGRSVAGSEFLFDTVESGLDFILAGNGSVLISPDRTCEAFSEYPSSVLRGMWEIAVGRGSLGLGPQAVAESAWLETANEDSPAALEAFIARNERVFQCNMSYYETEPALMTAALVNERYGDVVNALQNGGSVDIPARGVDKAFGVRRLAERLGVAENGIFAAGDQMNDYAMVSAFYGFAMAHAPEELRRAARRTVADVGEALEIIMNEEKDQL